MREMLLKEVQMAQFAVVETNLYLDTHPCDEEAMKALEYYSEKLAVAIANYESECGSLYASSAEGTPFDWVKTPFPWETECEKGKVM